jgi:hypothetical protein
MNELCKALCRRYCYNSSMMKLILRLFPQVDGEQPSLHRDDLWQHPALSHMHERELADLPFPRERDICSHIRPDAANGLSNRKCD